MIYDIPEHLNANLHGGLRDVIFCGEAADHLAVAAGEEVLIVPLTGGEEIYGVELPGHDLPTGLVALPSSDLVAACTAMGYLFTCDVRTGSRRVMINAAAACDSVAVHPTGRWAVVASGEAEGALIDLEERRVRAEIPLEHFTDEGRGDVQFTSDGDAFVISSYQLALVYPFDAGDVGGPRRLETSSPGFLTELTISPDGQRLAALSAPMGGGGGFRLCLWDLTGGGLLAERNYEEDTPGGAPQDIAWTPDGSAVVVADVDGDGVSFRGVETLEPVEYAGEVTGANALALAVHPGGDVIFAATEAGEVVCVWRRD